MGRIVRDCGDRWTAPTSLHRGLASRTLTRHGMPHPWQFHGWAAANSAWHGHWSQRNRRVPVISFRCRQTCTATTAGARSPSVFNVYSIPTEAAPPFAVFERWAPRTGFQCFLWSRASSLAKKNGVTSATPRDTIVEVPTLRKSRRVGQPQLLRCGQKQRWAKRRAEQQVFDSATAGPCRQGCNLNDGAPMVESGSCT